MAQKIGIVSVAKTKYEESRPNVDFSELAFEAIEKVLEETGLRYVDHLHGSAPSSSRSIPVAALCCGND